MKGETGMEKGDITYVIGFIFGIMVFLAVIAKIKGVW